MLRSTSSADSKHALMDSSAKYRALGLSDLEVVSQHDAPEVVPGSYPPINRKSSLLHPEPYHTAPYQYTGKQEHGQYYGRPDSVAPDYYTATRPSYINHDGKEVVVSAQETNARRDERRCCGLRRKIFIIVVVVVALLLCIGAVVGGVLGSQLAKDR